MANTPSDDLSRIMFEKDDDQLLAVLSDSESYTAEALAAAREEVARRGLVSSAPSRKESSGQDSFAAPTALAITALLSALLTPALTWGLLMLLCDVTPGWIGASKGVPARMNLVVVPSVACAAIGVWALQAGVRRRSTLAKVGGICALAVGIAVGFYAMVALALMTIT